MKQPKKFREKVSKKCKKNAEKEHFQGFSVFHLSLFLQVISIFRRYFCWKLSKKALYLQSKKQSSIFKARTFNQLTKLLTGI